jgi:hypothetical protein
MMRNLCGYNLALIVTVFDDMLMMASGNRGTSMYFSVIEKA